MSYIDFKEFKRLSGKTDSFKSSFDKYLLKASAILDNETNYFYQFHNIKDDSIDFRVNQFKLALCSQIVYFDEVGGDTYQSINKTPQSFSAGVRVSLISHQKMGGVHLCCLKMCTSILKVQDFYIEVFPHVNANTSNRFFN